MSYNYSTAVMLVNSNIRAVACSYEPDEKLSNGSTRKSDRVTFKTLDQTLKVGDLVVVPTHTRHMFTVMKVEELDVDVDFEGGPIVEWIIDTVRPESVAKVKEEEASCISKLKAAEKKDQREQLRKKLLGFTNEAEISGLAISQMKDIPVIEAQPTEAKA